MVDAHLKRRLESLAAEIFEAGKVAGREELRQTLAALVGNPPARAPTHRPPSALGEGKGAESKRAPRGALRQAIKAVLRDNPGMTEQELQERAPKLDPTLSPRSIGGELRRMRDKLYQQDGRKWFLMQAETAGSADPADALL
jgi:hypothetical protein